MTTLGRKFKGNKITNNNDGTSTVCLGRNKTCVVSTVDVPIISHFTWMAHKSKHTYYACTNVKLDKNVYKFASMHSFIMGSMYKKVIDHKDGNGLNNTRDNLRFVTESENCFNIAVRKDNKSGYTGITSTGPLWAVRVQKDGIMHFIGRTACLRRAIAMRNNAQEAMFPGIRTGRPN